MKESCYQVVIIGSGFGGQCAALNLMKMGISDFVMLERRNFVGGTWCQNNYPGAAVDVQSPLYSISSEPYDWSQMFAERDELEQYTRHVLDKHQLMKKVQLNANVTRVQWDASQHQWQVETEAQGVFRSQFVINASGPLSTPVIPDFKGKDSFEGVSFHTNNWDNRYDLKNKRVDIIGSGASAAQVIPAIAPDVAALHVFQRTPHWVLPRADYQFKPWQRKLLRMKPLYKLVRTLIYWSLELRVIGFKYSDFLLKDIVQKQAKRFIEQLINDPLIREKVTPDYTIGCKRIILSNTLYPTYCRENVFLHSREDSIQEIHEQGIRTAQGEDLALDLLVYSTGYDATDGVISYPVIGKEGKHLSDFWSDYPRAYLGTTVPEFPNLFIVTGPNTGIGHTSAIFIIESQMEYITRAISEVLKQQKKAIEVKADAEAVYTKMIHSEMNKTVWKKGGCNSWYQSKTGHVIAMFPGFSFTLRRWAKNFKVQDHILL